MTIQAPARFQKPTCTNKTLTVSGTRVPHFPAFSEEHVVIKPGSRIGDPVVITINCLYQAGLACDVARTIFEFGLNVVQADFSTDGQWCLLLFWVVSRTCLTESIRWAPLKKRLIAECPSSLTSLFVLSNLNSCSKNRYYLLQTCSAQSLGLLNDLSLGLWELELEILKVNLSTSPSGHAVFVILVSDLRSELFNKRRQVICDHVKCILGPTCSFCELTLATLNDFTEVHDHGMLLYDVPKGLIEEEKADMATSNDPNFSLDIDNSLSPSHTLLQITSRDRRGLLYDCMRSLSDLNLKVTFGRLNTTTAGMVVFDVFVSQANGTKLLDLDKLKSLQARLRLDVFDPIRVMIVDRGPNPELFVATTLEKSGRTRPRIMHDVTLVLKMLQIDVFKAETEKICNGDRMWEVYRFLLAEAPRALCKGDRVWNYVMERVKSVLSG